MLNVLLQASNRGHSVLSIFRHLGAFGLFLLTILDSSPLPTFLGPRHPRRYPGFNPQTAMVRICSRGNSGLDDRRVSYLSDGAQGSSSRWLSGSSNRRGRKLPTAMPSSRMIAYVSDVGPVFNLRPIFQVNRLDRNLHRRQNAEHAQGAPASRSEGRLEQRQQDYRSRTFASHQTAVPGRSASIAVGTQGRYVRVQLTGAGYLSLTEVQVFRQ